MLHFLTFLPDSIPSCVEGAIFDYARYQTEIAIACHSFVKLRASVVGFAALLNSIEGLDTALLPERIHDRFVRYILSMYTSIDIDEVEKTQANISDLMFRLLSKDDTEKYELLLDEDSDEDDDVDLSDDDDDDFLDDVIDDEDKYDDDDTLSDETPPTPTHRSPTSVMRKTSRTNRNNQ